LKKIAVLLAAFNGEKYIQAQVASILSQIDVDVNIYIRDDCSNDSTLKIIKELAVDPRIHIVQCYEPTSSAAGNFIMLMHAVKFCLYDFIAFSDQDDVWVPEKLKRATDLILQNKASGYSCDLISYSVYSKNVAYINKSHEPVEFDYLFQSASAGCTYVFLPDLAFLVCKQLEKLDIRDCIGFSHDWLIYAIARASKMNWCFDFFPGVFYRQHSNNVYGARSNFRDVLNKFNLAKSEWYIRNVLWISKWLPSNIIQDVIIKRINRLSIYDRFWLAMNVRKFRRRKRDRLVLVVLFFLWRKEKGPNS
jgi:rhamnosyltransferase